MPWSRVASGALLLLGFAPPPGPVRAQPAPPAAVAVAAQQPLALQLEVFVNDRATQLVAAFTQQADGGLASTRDELAQLGLRVPAGDAAESLRLDALPGLRYVYDAAAQAIRIEAAPQAQEPTRVSGGRDRDAIPPQRPPNGAVLNYSVYGLSQRTAGSGRATRSLTGAFDARAFGRWGMLENTWVAGLAGEAVPTVRLDTTYTYDVPEQQRALRIGDFVTGGFSWTRPIRMGGAQLRREFALRPDLIPTALPAIAGTAAAPSTLELYVQQVRTLSADVPPGPFVVDNPPVLFGSGQAQLVLRDALGRETVTLTPYYTSPQLLAPGVRDYSASIGFARRSYGTSSADYDDALAGSGSLRLGITRTLSLTGHVEATKGLGLVGGGVVTTLGSHALGSLSAAHSRSGDGSGSLAEAMVDVRHRHASVVLRLQRATERYRDLAEWTAAHVPVLGGDHRVFGQPRELGQLTVSVPLWRGSSLGVGYVKVLDAANERTQVVNASFVQGIGRSAVFASLVKDLGRGGATSVFVGLSIPLGERVTASLGANRNELGLATYAEASRSGSHVPGSWGWTVHAAGGERRGARGIVRHATHVGRMELGAEVQDGATALSGLVEGGIALVGRGAQLTPRLDEAFAVVDAGLPGVPVLHQNRVVGKTHGNGRLVVPGLVPFQENQVGIDPTELPLDAKIGATDAVAVPFRRAAVAVDLRVKTGIASALVVLVDAAGQPLPPGARVRVAPGAPELLVGYDGELYIEEVQARNELRIVLPDGASCTARFAGDDATGPAGRIGPVTCTPT